VIPSREAALYFCLGTITLHMLTLATSVCTSWQFYSTYCTVTVQC